jgi:RHS repeat-associated protein
LNQRTLTNFYNFMPRWYAYDERGHLTGSYAISLAGYFETVYLGDTPIAVMDSYYGVNYIDTDHLGSPRIITNPTQQPIWTWDPGSFGVNAPSGDPGHTGNYYSYYGRFPGQYYSDESSLHYNYYRDYDPGTGRYIESDPIGLDGGINTYAYGLNDPISKSDPSGLVVVPPDILERAERVLAGRPNKVPGQFACNARCVSAHKMGTQKLRSSSPAHCGRDTGETRGGPKRCSGIVAPPFKVTLSMKWSSV